jgi:hypothetical protein
MRRLHPFRLAFSVLGIALGLAVVACLLPERPYERWQLLDGTMHERARWIYERVHFDPRPIDVVVVGPSRIQRAIDPLQLQDLLSSPGHPVHVVNFALAQGGRDINDVIVEETLKTKRPKLIVIGVIEKPSRYGHPAYKYVTPRSELVDPGYMGNLNYAENVLYLPFRQMELAVGYVAPQLVGLTDHFNPARYDPEPANPVHAVTANGTHQDWTRPGTPEELREGIAKLEHETHPPLLPASLADVEFGDERHYIRRIAAEAQKKGVKIAFLFLPYCTGPSTVQEQKFYDQYGPVWNAGFIASHTELFYDYAHLTAEGSKVLTAWVAPYVSANLGKPQVSVAENKP